MKLKQLRAGTYFADVGVKLVANRVDGRSFQVFENGRFVGYEHSREAVRTFFAKRRDELKMIPDG